MSTLTKKQQKSQSFRTKGGKGGKKEAPVPEDVPEQDLLQDDDEDLDVPTTTVPEVSQKSIVDLDSITEPDGKKKSKSKLSKEKKLREKLAREAGNVELPGKAVGSAKSTGETGQKRKREEEIQTVPKVDKGKSKAVDEAPAVATEGDEAEESKEKKKTKKDIKQRFILFVGESVVMLPFPILSTLV